MSDYLETLIAKSTGAAEILRPRHSTMFEQTERTSQPTEGAPWPDTAQAALAVTDDALAPSVTGSVMGTTATGTTDVRTPEADPSPSPFDVRAIEQPRYNPTVVERRPPFRDSAFDLRDLRIGTQAHATTSAERLAGQGSDSPSGAAGNPQVAQSASSSRLTPKPLDDQAAPHSAGSSEGGFDAWMGKSPIDMSGSQADERHTDTEQYSRPSWWPDRSGLVVEHSAPSLAHQGSAQMPRPRVDALDRAAAPKATRHTNEPATTRKSPPVQGDRQDELNVHDGRDRQYTLDEHSGWDRQHALERQLDVPSPRSALRTAPAAADQSLATDILRVSTTPTGTIGDRTAASHRVAHPRVTVALAGSAEQRVQPFGQSLTPLTAAPRVAPPMPPSQPIPLSQPAPSVHVTIGQIEVRSVVPSPPPAPSPAPRQRGPALSLSDYLKQRSRRWL